MTKNFQIRVRIEALENLVKTFTTKKKFGKVPDCIREGSCFKKVRKTMDSPMKI